MALNAVSYQFISQQGLTRLIDASTGPDGPRGTTSHWLVPAGGYINSQRVPYDTQQDLEDQKFEKTTIEGIEYFLVPEESSNLPGILSHYAQLTGVAELQNPSGGGVNRVRETLLNTATATVAPEAVEKYLDDNDAFEEARKKASEEDERVARQVSASPAREPSEGKLVVADAEKADDVEADNPGRGVRAGSKEKSEAHVKSTGETKPK